MSWKRKRVGLSRTVEYRRKFKIEKDRKAQLIIGCDEEKSKEYEI